MRRIGFLLLAIATLAGIVAYMAHASGQYDGDSSPIYGVKIPARKPRLEIDRRGPAPSSRQGQPVARSTRQRYR